MSTVQASPKLLGLIAQYADCCIKSSNLVAKIVKQAREEGLSGSDCRELLESVLKRRGLSDGQIRRLIPSEFKRTYSKEEDSDESRNVRDDENPASNDVDIAKLQEQFDNIQSEVKQLRTLLVPFKAATTIEIRGNFIPIILEVDPQSRRVIKSEVNEAEARRLNQ